jgi:hypothetical protein
MGLGRMLLFGNWGQQMDIDDQKVEIESLRREMRRVPLPRTFRPPKPCSATRKREQ